MNSPDPNRKEAAESICLTRIETWIDFNPKDVLDVSDDVHQVQIKIEIRAWVCPWCDEATQYVQVGDNIVHGSGGNWLSYKGRWSSCCHKDACKQKQEAWHAEGRTPTTEATWPNPPTTSPPNTVTP